MHIVRVKFIRERDRAPDRLATFYTSLLGSVATLNHKPPDVP